MTVAEETTARPGAFRLDGKHALVTGGASGIGQATCRELVSAGARVFVADLNLAGAAALSEELGDAEPLHMDVTQPASVAAAFEKVSNLDILVNNAGIGHVGDILRTELEDLSRLLDVNVKSMFLVTRAAFPLLLASHGSIVNIGSVAGLVGVRHRLAYCTSKGAVIAMTRQIAVRMLDVVYRRTEEIASLVRYLCSTEAEFINGAVLPIDGGWTAA